MSSKKYFQTFRNSSSCYNSYLIRTVLELFTSCGMAAFYCGFRGIDGIARNLFDCNVHGISVKCVIPNSRFFWVNWNLIIELNQIWNDKKNVYCCNCNWKRNDLDFEENHDFKEINFSSQKQSKKIFLSILFIKLPHFASFPKVTYFLALILIFVYIILTTYNLVWLVHPKVCRLGRILRGMYRRREKSVDALDCIIRDPSIPEVRLDMYFDKKAKDFRSVKLYLD